jgi:hypothetical protein
VRLVIVGTIIIIVPFITSLRLHALSLLASVFYLAMCISSVDDVAQVAVAPIMLLAALLWWSDATGQVPMRTLPVVKLMTPNYVFVVVDQVHLGCCVQHRLEALDMCVDFIIIIEARVLWAGL